MPDKYLEHILNASKESLQARRAENERIGEAIMRENAQAGKYAAGEDYTKWQQAVEGAIGQSDSSGNGNVTLRFDTDAPKSSILCGYKRTFFGNYKIHFYHMNGFTEVCNSDWVVDRVNAYVTELQDRLGNKFKVSSDTGGYRTYREYDGGIEHDDGSTSSTYRTESYKADPSVTVRW